VALKGEISITQNWLWEQNWYGKHPFRPTLGASLCSVQYGTRCDAKSKRLFLSIGHIMLVLTHC